MGLEVESINRVKFQTIPARTEREWIFKKMFGAGEKKIKYFISKIEQIFKCPYYFVRLVLLSSPRKFYPIESYQS